MECSDFIITDEELKSAKECFEKYAFYQRLTNGDIEYWCTHCGSHGIIPALSRLESVEDREFKNIKHNEPTVCPECCRRATAKNTGKSKARKNLWEERRIVFIHIENENYVTAQGYEAVKNYEESLRPCIRWYKSTRYELLPGKWRCYEYNIYGGWSERKHPIRPFRWKSSMSYWACDNSYTVIGLNKLKDSFLKYHQLSLYEGYEASRNHNGASTVDVPIMRYICRFAEYPQIEMLQKAGFHSIVRSLVESNLKSFPIVNWKARDFAAFFKMPKNDFKQFLSVIEKIGGKDKAVDFLYMQRLLKKHGLKSDYAATAKAYVRTNGSSDMEYSFECMKNAGISIAEGFPYLMHQYDRLTEKNFRGVLIFYRDYLDMAKKLKLDLQDDIVRYPPNLIAAHDRAVEARNAVLEEEKAKRNRELQQKYKKLLKSNRRQYAYSDENFIIIVPSTAQEIINEGKALCHCVGGYAERHLTGKLTILFLRSVKEPDKSLYTIEMHGKTLTQVQGYHNRTPLTPEAKDFFERWLKWVQNGSPKEKNIKTKSA